MSRCRLIIAGGRDFSPTVPFINKVLKRDKVGVVICGMAKGVDSAGKAWAQAVGIPVEEYPANWDRYGKSAGYRRNVEMAENADALLAFWDGRSKGTGHMIGIARDKGLLIKVISYEGRDITEEVLNG